MRCTCPWSLFDNIRKKNNNTVFDNIFANLLYTVFDNVRALGVCLTIMLGERWFYWSRQLGGPRAEAAEYGSTHMVHPSGCLDHVVFAVACLPLTNPFPLRDVHARPRANDRPKKSSYSTSPSSFNHYQLSTTHRLLQKATHAGREGRRRACRLGLVWIL